MSKATGDAKRPRGRPRKPLDQRPSRRWVELPPALDDALCRLSNKDDVAINALIRKAVSLFLAQPENRGTEMRG
jgi:hypothetical protein